MKTNKLAEENTVMAEDIVQLDSHIHKRVDQYFLGSQYHKDVQELSAFASENAVVHALWSTAAAACIDSKKMAEALQVWVTLPEQSRLLCLKYFKERAEENDNKSLKYITLLFCKAFISDLIPVLSILKKR